ncbi:unnamed protein product [Peniophora sp. CBMAI 1063]|nr:unnamed protein product [Peniophora sp. CBMAI 1063]
MAGVLSAIGALPVSKHLYMKLWGRKSESEHNPPQALAAMEESITLRLMGEIERVEDLLQTLAGAQERTQALRTWIIINGFTITENTVHSLSKMASHGGNCISLFVIGPANEGLRKTLAGRHCLDIQYVKELEMYIVL